MRRFHADEHVRLDGVELYVEAGDKFPGDLRLKIRGSDGGWRPVHMSLVFYLVDFFAENEDARQPYVSYWRQHGDTYFLTKCVAAVKDGWQSVADEIERQRLA